MQEKKLKESESAVGSVHGSNSKRMSQMNPEEDESTQGKTKPKFRLDLEPFNVSNLRDKQGKALKVVFRNSSSKIYIEVHESQSNLREARNIVSSRVLKISDLEKSLQGNKL